MNEEVYQHILFLQMHYNHDEYSSKQRMPKKKGQESSLQKKKKKAFFQLRKDHFLCGFQFSENLVCFIMSLKNVAVLVHTIVKMSVLLFIVSILKSTSFVGLSFNYYSFNLNGVFA